MEAAAVNLTAGDKPADVYSEIAMRYIRKDSALAYWLDHYLPQLSETHLMSFAKIPNSFWSFWWKFNISV